MFYDIIPKKKATKLRHKLSNIFLWIAKKIYPESPDIYAFYSKLVMDQMITGKSIVRVDDKEFNIADRLNNPKRGME